MGILVLDKELSEFVDAGKDLVSGDTEVELRVCAIEASERMVAAIREVYPEKKVNSMELDYFLWTIGKDPLYRSTERHYTKNKIFY